MSRYSVTPNLPVLLKSVWILILGKMCISFFASNHMFDPILYHKRRVEFLGGIKGVGEVGVAKKIREGKYVY